ncbi:MAG TPA: HEPN domain-containing protein [Prolixibacteraceae bacterium]|nr:HEPN domain-containing protein [Prolixibacteraceae bacterium]
MDQFLKQYQILFRKANVDYRSAQNLYEDFQQGDSELDIDVILFHLQQCAEKCLKSILSFRKINFPKVHDLELLAKMVYENRIALELNIDDLIELNDFAVESRYAIIHDDLDNAEQYFQLLKKLVEQTEDLISDV